MTALAYIGNAVDAAGFRLAGALCRDDRDNVQTAFEQACASADVVLLDPQVAEALPRRRLDAALASGHPLTVILPRPGGVPNPLDPAERAQGQLGLER